MKPEFSLDPFNPGENIKLEAKYIRPKKAILEHVEMMYPARLHFSLIDYTQLNPIYSAGGGIGVSFNTSNTVSISKETSGQTTRPSVEHIKKLFAQLVNKEVEKYNIHIDEPDDFSHTGFGSTVARNTVIFSALNAMHGYPYDVNEMFNILTHNYVEDEGNSYVHLGFDTGVGQASLLYGGIVCVDRFGSYKGNIPTNDLFAVVAMGNMQTFARPEYLAHGLADTGETGKVESGIIETMGMGHQRQFGDELGFYYDNDLLPLFESGDASQFFSKIWRLNDIGTFKMKQNAYNSSVMLEFEREAKSSRALYAGMSSSGPGMFSLFKGREKAEEFRIKYSNSFAPYLTNFFVAEAGAPISLLNHY